MFANLFHVLPVLWALCSVGGHVVKRSTSSPPPSHSSADGNVIHCYCNFPSCITSSYMCKTEKTESGCFKRFDPTSRQYHYGCLDNATKQTRCLRKSPAETTTTEQDDIYHCCFSDMCNHESTEISSTSPVNNSSSNESDSEMLSKKLTSITLYTDAEIWFRAMLIAVPICGFTILLILVFIAIRILRSDVPDDGRRTPKLIKDKYEIAAATGVKLPQSLSAETCNYNLGNSFKSTKYTLLERSFPFVFRQQSQQHGNGGGGAKCAKYQGFIPRHKYVADDATGVHHVPKMSEKFSRQNLNILKLPHKLNELKQKGDKNTNVDATNNNRDYSISFSNSVTNNVHSYPDVVDLKKIRFHSLTDGAH